MTKKAITPLTGAFLSALACGCVDRLTAPMSVEALWVPSWGHSHAAATNREPSYSIIDYQRLLETYHDVYGEPFLFVVTSAAEWREYHEKMLERGGLIVAPPPQPPAGVNWETDAVLIIGMRSSGGAYAVHIDTLGRRGRYVLADVEIHWIQRLDPIEYSPSDMVKFTKWPGLRGSSSIGDREVVAALQVISLTAH